MKQALKKAVMMSVLCLPVLSMADTSSATCHGQDYNKLLTQCATSVDACTTIIKYNCLASDPKSSAITLSQITSMLQQHFASAAPSSVNDQLVDMPQQDATLAASESSTPAPVSVAQTESTTANTVQSTPSSNSKTNYWF